MLRRNVGGVDRVVRLALGAILFCGGLFLWIGKGSLGVIVAGVGLLVLLTGVVRFCALYIPFDISTARDSRRTEATNVRLRGVDETNASQIRRGRDSRPAPNRESLKGWPHTPLSSHSER